MLGSNINIAERIFLQPAKLDSEQLISLCNKIKMGRLEYADLYFQANTSESWELEDGIVRSGHFSSNKGVGIRAVIDEKSSLAFSEDLSLSALKNTITAASTIANHLEHPGATKITKITTGIPTNLTLNNQNKITARYGIENPLNSLSNQEKINILQYIDDYAKSLDPRVSKVNASLNASHDIILLVSTDGKYLVDFRPLVRLNIKIIAKYQGKIEQGNSGGGGRFTSYNIFTADNYALLQTYVKQAIHLATTNLSAIAAPAGNMPVVLAAGWPGILLHEAIGHGLEGDAIRKGTSVFKDQLGEKIASNLCHIVDDGTLPQARGSLNFDDEGTNTQKTVLINNGILTNYLYDILNAKLSGVRSTGNGRRQSYACLPLPRMTNTYMLPGKDQPKDLIKSVSNGIYAVSFAGGQVDVTSGKFVFEANESYLIENGQITSALKGTMLIGDGAGVLQRVMMIGNDLALDPGIGTCGKDGQYVAVGVGQPTLLIDHLTVGGTNVNS